MDASCLQYALTEAERLEFAQRGLHRLRRDALPLVPTWLPALVEVSDRN